MAWSVIKPEVMDGVGQPVPPGCHIKPDCTQPAPVGGLWDRLCREQVGDMLCPFAESTSHELESQTPRPPPALLSDVQNEVQKGEAKGRGEDTH